jgi:hypothetical protein
MRLRLPDADLGGQPPILFSPSVSSERARHRPNSPQDPSKSSSPTSSSRLGTWRAGSDGFEVFEESTVDDEVSLPPFHTSSLSFDHPSSMLDCGSSRSRALAWCCSDWMVDTLVKGFDIKDIPSSAARITAYASPSASLAPEDAQWNEKLESYQIESHRGTKKAILSFVPPTAG